MKYIKGFLMAWGNFSAVPCPYHKWHDESRKAMLCMLPVVGLMLAAITIIAWWLLDMIGAPPILTGALITVVYFHCNGFIHLDGFMDCSDAILSRRPELEERQRILKASDVGAFAVISVVFMALIFAASMITLAGDFTLINAGILFLIMTVSRSTAADSVGRMKPMMTSQYADMAGENGDGQNAFGFGESAIIGLIMAFVILMTPQIITLGNGTPAFLLYYAPVSIVVLAVASVAGAYARKQLGGMNGDISGYMIVMSETVGIAFATVLVSCVGL